MITYKYCSWFSSNKVYLAQRSNNLFAIHIAIPTLVGNSSAFNEHKYLCVMDIIKKSAFAL